MDSLKNRKHGKLLYILVILLIVVLGFFAYKFIYIFMVRRQLSPVAADFKQMQADLKQAGVDTEYTEVCGKDQGKNGTGAKHCGVSLSYLKPLDAASATKESNIILLQANKIGLQSDANEILYDAEQNDFDPYDIIFSHTYGAAIQCSLTYQNINDIEKEKPVEVNFELYCGRKVKVPVFTE